MRVVSDFREAMWGVLQQGISTLDVDFRGYAGEHFDRLLANAATPLRARAARDRRLRRRAAPGGVNGSWAVPASVLSPSGRSASRSPPSRRVNARTPWSTDNRSSLFGRVVSKRRSGTAPPVPTMKRSRTKRISARLQGLGGPGEHHAAIGDHDHLVGDRQGLVDVVGDHDAGQPQRVIQAPDKAHDHAAGDRIQPAQRLVVQHQRLVERVSSGRRLSALPAAGEFARKRVDSAAQADGMQFHFHQPADQRLRQAWVRAQRQRTSRQR